MSKDRLIMRINIKNIFLFLLLIGTLGACDTFKDENSSDYVELPKNIQGTWQLMEVTRNGIDISQKMDLRIFIYCLIKIIRMYWKIICLL